MAHTLSTTPWSSTDNEYSSSDNTLPSAFIMEDGTDWGSHVGSIFGTQASRKLSTIDQNPDFMLAQTEAYCPFDRAETTTYDNQNIQYKDEITLQDVRDEGEPWSTLHMPDMYPHEPLDYPLQATTSLDTYPEPEPSESSVVITTADPCYARLLHTCLQNAPQHILSLKDIYAWIKTHTHKARDPKNKGWQNSVRHNLSMNAAFERVNASDQAGSEAKKGSLWRLSENAISNGVISTTRYRRDPKRKPERRGQPALKRQLSGAKGGAATRAASQYKRHLQAQQIDHYKRQQYTSIPEQRPLPPHRIQVLPFGQSYSPAPYFVGSVSPSIAGTSAYSSPYSTPTMPTTPAMPFNQDYTNGCLRDFQMSYIESGTSIFGNVDDPRSYTPSLVTDNSYNVEDPTYTQSFRLDGYDEKCSRD